MNRLMGRLQPWLIVAAGAAVLALALPVAAQTGAGRIIGKVVDEKGQPVEEAKITVDSTENGRHYETKTDKKGEYVQIGLTPGAYKVTADKPKVGTQEFDVRVRVGAPLTLNFQLVPGAISAAMAPELKKAFDAGIAASRAGNFDDAIASFNQAVQLAPKCQDCYYNLGYNYGQKKDYDNAETAFKKAIELKPDYGDAYSGLANIYNAQRKFDEAAAASAKATEFASGGGAAGGGGNADALYNQGVILWNAGKVADAKKQFQAAIQANPNHAESHYQLGMALVNEGNLADAANEFDTYLKLAPMGPNAAQAKALVEQLKK